jgi:hypothetical protein
MVVSEESVPSVVFSLPMLRSGSLLLGTSPERSLDSAEAMLSISCIKL